MPAEDKTLFSPSESLTAQGNLDTSYSYGISRESTLMFMKRLYLITHVFLSQPQAWTVTLHSVLSFCCIYGPIVVPNICLRNYFSFISMLLCYLK